MQYPRTIGGYIYNAKIIFFAHICKKSLYYFVENRIALLLLFAYLCCINGEREEKERKKRGEREEIEQSGSSCCIR